MAEPGRGRRAISRTRTLFAYSRRRRIEDVAQSDRRGPAAGAGLAKKLRFHFAVSDRSARPPALDGGPDRRATAGDSSAKPSVECPFAQATSDINVQESSKLPSLTRVIFDIEKQNLRTIDPRQRGDPQRSVTGRAMSSAPPHHRFADQPSGGDALSRFDADVPGAAAQDNGGTTRSSEATDLSPSEFADEIARLTGSPRILLPALLAAKPLARHFSRRFLRETMVFPFQSAQHRPCLAVVDPRDTA